MKRARPTGWFTWVMLVLLGSLIGGFWQLTRDQLRSMAVAAHLEKLLQERDRLTGLSPVLSAENESALQSEINAATGRRNKLRKMMQAWSPVLVDSAAPTQSRDAYFAVANLVEKIKAGAIRAQVALRPDERFGLGAYRHEGPASDQLALVHRQCIMLQFLLEVLLESRPRELLGVWLAREAIEKSNEQPSKPDDRFESIRPLSIAKSNCFAADAVRVVFSGDTTTLRSFLERLSDPKHRTVVRSVEIEPMVTAPPHAVAGDKAPGGTVVLVRPEILKISVTVEFAYLLSASIPDNPRP